MKPRQRRSFVDLREADVSPLLGDSALFLGRLDQESLRQELIDGKILGGLERKGHSDVVLEVGLASGEHRLRVALPGGGESLIDLRMTEGAIVVGDSVLSVLSIAWLSLQDPGAPFTSGRPRLPGQTHPGLGLGRPLMRLVLRWASSWGKDALLNLPMYFHNATIYSAIFSFVEPRSQGRFEALCRDLEGRSLADASAAVNEGRVVEYPLGQRFEWEADKMLAPLTERAKVCAASPSRDAAVRAAREGVRFVVVES